jgi:hypothetical protein
MATVCPAIHAAPAIRSATLRLGRQRATRAFRATRGGGWLRSKWHGKASRWEKSARSSRMRSEMADATWPCCRNTLRRTTSSPGAGIREPGAPRSGNAGAARRTHQGMDRYRRSVSLSTGLKGFYFDLSISIGWQRTCNSLVESRMPGSNLIILTVRRPLPVCPDTQTFSASIGILWEVVERY